MVPVVRRATANDATEIVDLVVEAFVAEEATGYFFGDDYATYAPPFFAYLLDLRLRGGEVWVATEGGEVSSVAMFNPPGGLALPPAEVDQAWETVATTFPADVRARLDNYQDLLGDNTPTTRHYYLGVLATHPDRQGRGLSGTVLDPVLSKADERGWDTYLETASSQTASIYRRFGFSVSAQVDLPDGPRIWWMRRPTGRP